MVRYFQTFSYTFSDVRHWDDIIIAKETFYANVEESFSVTIYKALALIEDRCGYYFRETKRAQKNDRKRA